MELVQPRLEIPLWSIQERITSNTDKYLGMDEICWGLGDQYWLNQAYISTLKSDGFRRWLLKNSILKIV